MIIWIATIVALAVFWSIVLTDLYGGGFKGVFRFRPDYLKQDNLRRAERVVGLFLVGKEYSRAKIKQVMGTSFIWRLLHTDFQVNYWQVYRFYNVGHDKFKWNYYDDLGYD